MDDLDVAILREIGIEPYASAERVRDPWKPEALAAKLDANPRLVKDRVARLEREVVERYELFPHPGHLGLAWRSYAFRFAEKAGKRERLASLVGAPGHLLHVDFLSDWAIVGFAWRSEAEHAERLADFGRRLGARPVTWFASDLPPTPRPLGRVDWRILRALRPDAKRALHEVAEDAGVSTKTVQRRLAALAQEGAFDVFARLDVAAIDRLLFCAMSFEVEEARFREAMTHLHGSLLAKAWSHCNGAVFEDGLHFDVVAAARTPGGIRDLVEAAEKIPGVRAVEAHVAASVTWDTEWIDAAIEARLAELAPA